MTADDPFKNKLSSKKFNTGVLKMQAQRKNANAANFMNLFFRKFPFQSLNIINIPLFALLWEWIHVYLYLGPSDIHVIRLDLNNLRQFQVVRKQLVKVVWRALNFVQMITDDGRVRQR